MDPDISLQDYAETWLKMRSVRATTRARYDAALRLHVFPALGDLPVAEITRDRVRRFVAEKLGDPKASLQGRQPARVERRRARALHRNSVRHLLKTLSAVLNAAVADELLPANPLRDLGREMFGRTRRGLTRKVRAMDGDQLRAFLTEARRRPDTFPVFVVLAMTGLRFGEAGGLRWEDIDWLRSRLQVTRQLSGPLKTPESERDAEIPAAPVTFLRNLRAERRQDAFARGQDATWLLFPELPERPTRKDGSRVSHRVR